MKKLLSVISICLAIGLFVGKAQAQSPVSLGIRGGLNFSNLNNVDNSDARTGFMAGAYLNLHIPMSPISIQPEVLYTQKGVESGNVTEKLDYIEIPVLVKFNYILDGPITPHVYFGPYLGINVNAEIDGAGVVADIPGGNSGINDNVEKTDLGVVVGAGVDISKFNIGVRYGAGLTKVFKDDNNDSKNSVLSIVAGVNF